LGLLLVFRTNSSYERFWDGRRQWGGIVNETRNLARQAEAWLATDPQRVRKCICWAIEFPFATMHRLRGVRSNRTVTNDLSAEEISTIQQARNVPLAVARKLTQLIYDAHRDGLIDTQQLRAFDQNIQLLVDYLGGCDRIRSTPAPYAYVVHLRRALIVYCLTLPLVFVRQFGWETIVVTLVVSYIMFGIEEIGVEIENPFGTTVNDLQMEVICNTINGDLLSILESVEK
jgi:putative membrane protein